MDVLGDRILLHLQDAKRVLGDLRETCPLEAEGGEELEVRSET